VQGVYALVNKVDRRQYVGSSIDIDHRCREHMRYLRRDRHHCSYLQRAWTKYGEEMFVVEVIEMVSDRQKLKEREQYYLDVTVAKYNASSQAARPPGMTGRHHSQEAKQRMSIAAKARDPGYKELLRKALAGRKLGPRTDDTKARISAKLAGRKLSSAQLAKMIGRPKTPEHRAKLSASHKGQVISQQQRAAQSERMKQLGLRPPSPRGRVMTAAHRANLSAALKGRVPSCGHAGRKHSAETKAIISEKLKGNTNRIKKETTYARDDRAVGAG